ncbi:MAG: hypothetical protein B7Z20_01230 [Sphingobium sp. 32-64-5]|nr:MAG: hypothetical protein B7Z20_01230 [Sphingobium sp. 32-64-5]
MKEGGGGGEGDGRLAPVASRLAGLAGWHLGWSADQFWQATPVEMEGVIRVMLGVEEGGGEGIAAPSRTRIARLQEMFPDG